MKDIQSIITRLEALADESVVLQKEKKFGVISNNALGVYQKDLRILAKEIGRNKELAFELFDQDIYEAKVLASKILSPKEVTLEFMEKCVVTFDNWEICDSFCSLFAKTLHAKEKIKEWVTRENEFEKRAGFATLAFHSLADKKSNNDVFEAFFPMIRQASTDERIYVKKAVNWALRQIGKRNQDLNQQVINFSKELLKSTESKAAIWIAKDALRELEKEGINILQYPRTIYTRKTNSL